MAHSIVVGDPSLRLKNGCAQDDAIDERRHHQKFKLSHYRRCLLSDCRLVADGLPVSVAANPDASVAIRAAEIFAELLAFHVGAGGDYGGVAIDSHDHIRNIHGFVAELTAAAGSDGLLFRGDLAERGDGDVVFGEGARGKFRIAVQAGVLGLTLHVDDLTDGFLLAGVETGTWMQGNMLTAECR